MSSYEQWNQFSNRSDESVDKWNSTHQKCCPFCGHQPQMFWNYDSNYDPYFIIQCHNCDAQIKSDSFDEAVVNWNKRINTDLEKIVASTNANTLPSSQPTPIRNVDRFKTLEEAEFAYGQIKDHIPVAFRPSFNEWLFEEFDCEK